MQSESTISGCQFVTSTNTGVFTTAATPAGGSDANAGATIPAFTRANTNVATTPGAGGVGGDGAPPPTGTQRTATEPKTEQV